MVFQDFLYAGLPMSRSQSVYPKLAEVRVSFVLVPPCYVSTGTRIGDTPHAKQVIRQRIPLVVYTRLNEWAGKIPDRATAHISPFVHLNAGNFQIWLQSSIYWSIWLRVQVSCIAWSILTIQDQALHTKPCNNILSIIIHYDTGVISK